MTEIDEDIVVGLSKFMKITLMLSAMILILVGPTYVPYLLTDFLKVEYVASITIGFVLFILGMLLMVYLIRKKVIT